MKAMKKEILIIFLSSIVIYSGIVFFTSLPEIRQGMLVGRGEAMLKARQFELALELFDRMVEEDPNFEKAYYNRARAYLGLKEYEKALAECEIGMRKSNSISVYYDYLDLKVTIYIAMQNYAKAREFCDEAISAVPEFSQAYSLRGAVYFYQHDYYQALKDCDRAIQINASDAMA